MDDLLNVVVPTLPPPSSLMVAFPLTKSQVVVVLFATPRRRKGFAMFLPSDFVLLDDILHNRFYIVFENRNDILNFQGTIFFRFGNKSFDLLLPLQL
jgi:hypothetical protein